MHATTNTAILDVSIVQLWYVVIYIIFRMYVVVYIIFRMYVAISCILDTF